jgi:hypothetical protein
MANGALVLVWPRARDYIVYYIYTGITIYNIYIIPGIYIYISVVYSRYNRPFSLEVTWEWN